MYVVDLHKDKQLLRKIKWFIENLLDHGRLEAVAEPSLVKYLLGLKREIIMQGVPMESQRKKNEEKKYPRPKMIEEEEEEDITSEESLLSL